jgi:hypothetical protein
LRKKAHWPNAAAFSTLNGPVYLAANTEIWEGTNIRGPFAYMRVLASKNGYENIRRNHHWPLLPHRRRGKQRRSLGLFQKGHEGYLGNAVIGEWCNLGADTNNSNLKNNYYGEVKLWDYPSQSYA